MVNESPADVLIYPVLAGRETIKRERQENRLIPFNFNEPISYPAAL